MREILFRGKTDKGKWVEGFYGQFHNRPTVNEPNIHQIFTLFTEEEEKQNEGHIFSAIGGLWHTVIPETIGQYTGLTDKNGTKIFEGDIVKCTDTQYDYEFIAVVLFGNPNGEYNWGFQLKRVSGAGANTDILLWVEMEETGALIEVIGNIHDNPEPLKGGAE